MGADRMNAQRTIAMQTVNTGETGEREIAALPRVRKVATASSLVLLMLIATFGFEFSGRFQSAAVPPPTVLDEPLVDLAGGWVIPESWFMGLAVAFEESGTFSYWFFSDVVYEDEPDYPLRGTWRWNGAILELSFEDPSSKEQYYPIKINGKVGLMPDYERERLEKEGVVYEEFVLFKHPYFDTTKPFAARPRAELQIRRDSD